MARPGGFLRHEQRLTLGDFGRFWIGQAVSTLGTTFSLFAIPLLIFQLTHSAISLAIATISFALPNLLFGLLIGAWVDRANRKRLMILVDVVLALTVTTIPLLALLHHLVVWWIYVVVFISSTLSLVFQQAEFTAIPSLVGQRDLVTANGRITASYNAARVVGPAVAGVLVSVVPVASLLIVDAASYVVSAAALMTVAASFNGAERPLERKLLKDIREGLVYVVHQPVLRNISLMMLLLNLVGGSVFAQSVLFAKERLGATNAELGFFFAAGSLGAVGFSLLAGRLRRRFSFSFVLLGTLMGEGLSLLAMSAVPWFWGATACWFLYAGFGSLVNINTYSLRQAIVPNHMLGRVLSVAGLFAFSAMPIGTLAVGFAIQRWHNLPLVYGTIGLLLFLIPIGFSRTALGRADQYLDSQTDVATKGPA